MMAQDRHIIEVDAAASGRRASERPYRRYARWKLQGSACNICRRHMAQRLAVFRNKHSVLIDRPQIGTDDFRNAEIPAQHPFLEDNLLSYDKRFYRGIIPESTGAYKTRTEIHFVRSIGNSVGRHLFCRREPKQFIHCPVTAFREQDAVNRYIRFIGGIHPEFLYGRASVKGVIPYICYRRGDCQRRYLGLVMKGRSAGIFIAQVSARMTDFVDRIGQPVDRIDHCRRNHHIAAQCSSASRPADSCLRLCRGDKLVLKLTDGKPPGIRRRQQHHRKHTAYSQENSVHRHKKLKFLSDWKISRQN